MASKINEIKIDTMQQYRIMQYINAVFKEDALSLDLINGNLIRAYDKNGNCMYFYLDEAQDRVRLDLRK